ncbi:MAG: hypothetical protein AB1458_14880 [Bacteroidota bacterium]
MKNPPETHKAEYPLTLVPTAKQPNETSADFSAEELREFKDLMLCMLDEKRMDHELLKSTLSFQQNSSASYNWLEDAAGVFFKKETAHLAEKQARFIERLQLALIHIENKLASKKTNRIAV